MRSNFSTKGEDYMKWRIVLIMLIAAALMYIPYVDSVVKGFNTLFHEGGHAITSLVTNGKVDNIKLFANTEGVTTTASSSWFSSLLTSISGYVFAAATAFLFAYLWHKHMHQSILYSTLIFATLNLVLWVRNLYGLVWLVAICAFLYFVVVKFKKEVNILSNVSLVLVLVLITQSVVSSFDILYLSYFTPNEAGDASNLASSTLLPSLVWGLGFFLQSLIWAFFSLRFIWKTKEKSIWF
ncbi:hypothetical protein CN918_32460 [Priestia megaterium]|nr:hypothetical protein CN918_32460 [Priestia megaterium]